eukprot:gene24291-31598_t
MTAHFQYAIKISWLLIAFATSLLIIGFIVTFVISSYTAEQVLLTLAFDFGIFTGDIVSCGVLAFLILELRMSRDMVMDMYDCAVAETLNLKVYFKVRRSVGERIRAAPINLILLSSFLRFVIAFIDTYSLGTDTTLTVLYYISILCFNIGIFWFPVAIVLVILYEVMQVNQINEQISARLSEQDWNGTIDQTEHPLGAMIFNYMPSKLSLTFQALCSLLGMCVSLYLKLKH